jgi:signal transduction histidine kinase
VRVGRLADGAVEIAVADDGPGIADAEKPKATERFFRGDSSRASPGVGLGLYIVDAVAKLHGGVLHLLDNRPRLLAQMVLPVATPPPAAEALSLRNLRAADSRPCAAGRAPMLSARGRSNR